MLTLANHIALMNHAVGNTVATGHDLYETFNRAGRFLFQVHDWSWKLTGPTAIEVTADQDYLIMPGDFHQCVQMYIDNSDGSAANYTDVQLIDLPRITAYRQNNFDNIASGSFYVHIPIWTQSESPNSVPQIRAMVYPTPTTDAEPTLTMLYLRRWREMTSANPGAFPNIPLDFENALTLIARAFAIRVENPESDYANQTMQEFGANIEQLKRYDGQRQLEYGEITGGARSRSQLVPMFNVGLATL